MNVPKYVSTLYYKTGEKIRYAGKKTLDLVLEVGNALFPQSQLELALAGVSNNFIGNQYGPPDQYEDRSKGMFLFAKRKRNSSDKPSIKRIGWDGGSNNVYVDRTGGDRIIIRPMDGKRRAVKRYVQGVLDANGIDYTGKDVNEIINKLKNPN